MGDQEDEGTFCVGPIYEEKLSEIKMAMESSVYSCCCCC